MQIKQNLALWVAVAIPVVVMIAVAALIYWPQGNIEGPKHNFVYALRDYGDGYDYAVKGGALTREQIQDVSGPVKARPIAAGADKTRFFVHDVAANEGREIPFEEAAKFNLDSNLTAPDGYELKRGNSGGGVFPFFFDNSNYDKQYLVLKNYSGELNIKKTSDSSYQPFEFIGWVL